MSDYRINDLIQSIDKHRIDYEVVDILPNGNFVARPLHGDIEIRKEDFKLFHNGCEKLRNHINYVESVLSLFKENDLNNDFLVIALTKYLNYPLNQPYDIKDFKVYIKDFNIPLEDIKTLISNENFRFMGYFCLKILKPLGFKRVNLEIFNKASMEISVDYKPYNFGIVMSYSDIFARFMLEYPFDYRLHKSDLLTLKFEDLPKTEFGRKLLELSNEIKG